MDIPKEANSAVIEELIEKYNELIKELKKKDKDLKVNEIGKWQLGR